MAKTGTLTLYVDRCKGCGLCVDYCPHKLLRLQADLNLLGYHPVHLAEEGQCTGCGICALMCPDMIIRVERGDGDDSSFDERQ